MHPRLPMPRLQRPVLQPQPLLLWPWLRLCLVLLLLPLLLQLLLQQAYCTPTTTPCDASSVGPELWAPRGPASLFWHGMGGPRGHPSVLLRRGPGDQMPVGPAGVRVHVARQLEGQHFGAPGSGGKGAQAEDVAGIEVLKNKQSTKVLVFLLH